MKFLFIVFLTVIELVNNLFAYPISPRPLRQLVMESQYIIVGYVIKTHDKKVDNWSSKVATIAIVENLQGQISKDTIEIEFVPNMICPAPARYFDSTYVISFVDRDNKGNYHTHALNYGAKTLSKKDIEIYKKRIFEIQEILKLSNEEKKFTETVEWLVKCAEVEPTRWEGIFELSTESDFMSFYTKDKKHDFKNLLTIEQKVRMKSVVISLKYGVNFGLIDLVYKGNECEVDDFLLTQLKSFTGIEHFYWLADNFINRLKHKNSSAEMINLLENYEQIRFKFERKNELKKIIETFIKLVEKSKSPTPIW